MTAPTALHQVCYFPINNAGYEMWASGNYNGVQYQADMVTAKALGFSSIRIYVSAQTVAFTFPSPTGPQLARLVDFYNRSKTVGIKLRLVVFNFWSASWTDIPGSKTWITAVLGALPDFTNIEAIEVYGESPFSTVPAVVTWTQAMIPYIRPLAPGVPVIVSATGPASGDLAVGYAALNGTSAAPDWYEYHAYPNNSNYGLAFFQILGAINVVGAQNLVIGETGDSTTPVGTQGTLQAQQYQSDFHQTVRWCCAVLGLSEPGVWTLFDFNSSAEFPGGQTFGIYTTAGAPKILTALYQKYPPGSWVPPVDLNGNMVGASQPDTNGNALPPRWTVFTGGAGNSMTTAIDTTNLYGSSPSILCTNTVQVGGNPPALQSLPAPTPIMQPSLTYTFQVALKATGSYGTPFLQISWYSNTDTFITSTPFVGGLTLTSSFALHSLSSVAPPNAAYAQLYVNVPGNAGSIWVSGAGWTSNAPRMLTDGTHHERWASAAANPALFEGGYNSYNGFGLETTFLRSIGIASPLVKSMVQMFAGNTSTWATTFSSVNGFSDIANFTGRKMLTLGGQITATPRLWTDVTGGGQDAGFTTLFQYCHTNGFQYIRFMHEQNDGTDYPWNVGGNDTLANQKGYVGVWQHVWALANAVAPGYFKWVYCPTVGVNSASVMTNMFTLGDPSTGGGYYPGNAYVDYIGLDCYNKQFFNSSNSWPGAATFKTTIVSGTSPNWTDAINFAQANGKGLAVPEWGCWPGATAGPGVQSPGDDAAFVDTMFSIVVPVAQAGTEVIFMPWNDVAQPFSGFPNALAELAAKNATYVGTGLLGR